MAEEMETSELAEASAAPMAQNGKLAQFDVQKKIGKGQFSEVYRAKHKMNILALKKVQVSF